MEVKNWFKCNTIRYFALDVKRRDNHKNWYTSRIADNININNSNQPSASSSTVGSWWNYSAHSRMGKEFARYSENDNGRRTRKSHAGGQTQFFIREVRNHYRHLNNEVYTPLATLTTDLIDRDLVSPLWKKHFDVDGHIPNNFLDGDRAICHITEDNAQLLTEVRDYQLLFDQYQTQLNLLQSTIDSIVRNKFIERGIFPTASNNYQSFGCYVGEVNSLLELVWVDFIVHMNNLALYQSSNNITSRTFQHDGDYLRLDGYIIGRGNEPQRTTMQNILENIPRNQIILDAFRDLRNSRNDLDNRAQLIRNLSQPFSNAIRYNEYQTLSACCPTQNATIWDFG